MLKQSQKYTNYKYEQGKIDLCSIQNFLLFQYQIDEVRSSRQGGDASDRKFRRSCDGAGESVGNQQEEGAEKERVSEQPPVVAAEEQPRHMRHDQPDEADGTAEGYHHRNQYGRGDEDNIGGLLRVDAQCLCRLRPHLHDIQ